MTLTSFEGNEGNYLLYYIGIFKKTCKTVLFLINIFF